jgi:ubiquinone/menaquinone biosynthesis C-methylase UbiE
MAHRADFRNQTFRQLPTPAAKPYADIAASYDTGIVSHHDIKVRMVEAANLELGMKVLDLACGTGILGRLAGEIVGADNVAYCDKWMEMIEKASQ